MKFKVPLLLLSTSVLAACNSGSGSSSNSGSNGSSITKPSSDSIAVSDVFVSITPQEDQFIDLKPYITGSNAKIEFEAVQSEEFNNALCNQVAELSSDGLGVNINAPTNTYCEYEFSAVSGTVRSTTAMLSVISTTATEPNFAPISKPIVYANPALPLEIDLSSELGAEWHANLQLKQVSLRVSDGIMGSTNIKAGTTDTIEFHLPETELPGWNRVHYVLSDSTTTPAEDKFGIVFIAISESQNTAPEISEPVYNYHVRATEFDLEFESRNCNLTRGTDDSQSCPAFSDFNNFEFKSALYSPTFPNHVRSIELYPRAAYHGKQVTIIKDNFFTVPVTTLFSSDDGSFSNPILGLSAGEAMTLTNISGKWYRENAAAPLITNTAYTLDLNAMQGLSITDIDGDDWGISSVSSYTAAVTLTNSNDPYSKSIEFEAARVGTHQVNYVVNDNSGGYSSGMIEVKVEPKGSKTWTDALTTVDGKAMTAPKLYAEHAELGEVATDFYDAEAEATVATFTLAQAQAYCTANGAQIATVDDFTDNRARLNDWPMEKHYWVLPTSTSTELQMYDLTNNAIATGFISSVATKLYTACVAP